MNASSRIWINGTVVVLSSTACSSTREMRNAPKIPNTLPKAAPISRFMLTSRIRISNSTTHAAETTPTAIAAGPSSENGCRK